MGELGVREWGIEGILEWGSGDCGIGGLGEY